jgi:hypothetical protein
MSVEFHLPPDGAFDPETIRVLTAVFEDAWRALDGGGSTSPQDDAKRDKLARLIIGLAKAGACDMAKLRDDAVVFMRLSSGGEEQAGSGSVTHGRRARRSEMGRRQPSGLLPRCQRTHDPD